MLRQLGFSALSTLVAVYGAVAPVPGGRGLTLAFAIGSQAYAAAVWLLLSRIQSPRRHQWLSHRFAEIDIVWFALAVYVTGGHTSWLLPLLTIRAADHVSQGFGRVVWYGHLSVGCYGAMLLWQGLVEHRPVAWPVELFKAMALYGMNLYISLTARTVDRLNESMQATQRALKEAKEAAESAARAKSDFLAGMSHEFRTPLNSVIGYSQLLREQLERLRPEQIRADLEQIEASGGHLLELVNQVLDFERLGSNRIRLAVEEFDPALVVEDVVAVAQSLARRRDNALVARFEPGGVVALGDPMRFRQSLINLVANACKFTESGDIVVAVAARRHEGRQFVEVSVRDTGIGIRPEHMDRLFQAFMQADSAIGRKYGGTGLGLALTKQFCELMGGGVSASSEFGKGSEFRLRIPAAPGP